MLGVGTRLGALRVLRNRLLGSGSQQLEDLGHLIDTQSGWANYGALGPAWGDFCPLRVDQIVFGQPGANAYAEIWKRIFYVFGGDETAANPGLKPVLDRIRNLLTRLETIAADEDLSALQGMAGEIGEINQIAVDLSAVIVMIKGEGASLDDLGIVPEIVKLISETNKPSIVRPRADGNVGFPARYWSLREFLSWRRTGRFAKRLWDGAQASGSDELKAYALGWLSTWSVTAGGGGALASIIGAPYRNHWWRARFVANFVDLWAHGYAEAGPSGPPYAAWPHLCDAQLNKRIEIPGTAFDAGDLFLKLRSDQQLGAALPAFFTDYFAQCYEDVYGDLGTQRPKLDAGMMQDGYAMAWLVLWFQTSPQSLGCHHTMPPAPTTCGTAPSWTNPLVPGDAGGNIGPPPAPSVDPKVKPENIVCAVLLAILGIVALCFGGLLAGSAAIAAAIHLAVNAITIDWDKLRCDIGWYRLYLYNGLRALHHVLSLGGLVHPYKSELSADTTAYQLLQDFPIIVRTGDNIVRSRLDGKFPALPWEGSGFAWYDHPSGGIEQPSTVPTTAAAYASGFMDDQTNPFGSASVFDPAPFPFAAVAGSEHPVGFINSADAVCGWLAAGGGDIPDRNLDGDRGLGFRGWEFVDAAWTNPVDIREED